MISAHLGRQARKTVAALAFRLLIFAGLFPAAAGADGVAAEVLRELVPGPSAFARVSDGHHTISFGDDAVTVVLAGLWRDPAGHPPHPDVGDGLRRAIDGRKLKLYFDALREDRFGRTIAHVAVLDEQGAPVLWLQRYLLLQGLARVSTSRLNHALAEELLTAEAKARAAKSGLWSDGTFVVRNAADTAMPTGEFSLVQGKIAKVAGFGGLIYLNFGSNWRDDFTIAVERRLSRRVHGGLKGLQKLEGRDVRVRGWVFRLNGPAIRADHSAQIEILR